MKKAIITILMSACAMMTLAGCGNNEAQLDDSQVKLGDYKGLEVSDPGVVEVTDEDVDAAVQSSLSYLTETVEVTDRPVQSGDYINYDFAGTVDGEAFEGGTAEAQTLLVGGGTMIDGFEDGIIGMEIGETKDVSATFPEDYRPEGDPAEDLNGAEAIFTITVHSITEYIVPELTDEIIPSLSETSTTVDEYKEEVRKEYKAYYEDLREESIRQEAWSQVIANSKVVELPQEEVDAVYQEIRTSYEKEAEGWGSEFADYISTSFGMTEEEFDAEAKAVAEDNVQEQIVLKLIAAAEGIEPTEEEVNAFYEDLILETTLESVEVLKEEVDAETLEYLVLDKFVIDWVVDHAELVEVEVTE